MVTVREVDNKVSIMHPDQQRMADLFADFLEFVEDKDKKSLTEFKLSPYIDEQENYKYSIYEQTRYSLKNKSWEKEDIGTGKIQKYVADAIKRQIYHNGLPDKHNLIDWRKKDDFSKRQKDSTLEEALFRFYKSNDIKPVNAFEAFEREGLPYQLIAYLFFIKDREKFMPISQRRFDSTFAELGLPDFVTDRNCSWANYSTFNDIIREVREFLLPEFPDTTLLDAHSFLWIIGDQMKEENFISTRQSASPATIQSLEDIGTEESETLQSTEKDDEQEYYEGTEIFQLHKRKERNRRLIDNAKATRLKLDPRLCCEACGFSFMEKYGELGQGFIEAHHLTPISQLTEEKAITISELALVCANCHRMLHRKNAPTLAELKKLFEKSQLG